MNKEKILQAIDDYFKNATPEEVVAAFEELGCEFDDVKPYSHLELNTETIYFSCDVAGTIEIPEMDIFEVAKDKSIEFSNPINKSYSEDKDEQQLPEAA